MATKTWNRPELLEWTHSLAGYRLLQKGDVKPRAPFFTVTFNADDEPGALCEARFAEQPWRKEGSKEEIRYYQAGSACLISESYALDVEVVDPVGHHTIYLVPYQQ